jgi:hypothetical protein
MHPKFKGRVTVKYVLPALLPNLTCKDLNIRGGAQASEAEWSMVSSTDAGFVSCGVQRKRESL